MERILHVIGKRPTGGIGTVVKNYQKYIDKRYVNFDYLIFNDNPTGQFDEDVKKLGSNVYVLPELKNTRLFLINREIKNFFRRHSGEYKIVHLHSANIGFMVLKYAKQNGVKIRIIHSHSIKYSNKFLNSLRNYFLYKYSLVYANNYFYCSNSAKDFLFNDKKNNLFQMYNAIESHKYIFDINARLQIRRELGIKSNQLVLLNVARYTKEKNIGFIIDVIARLKKKKKDFKLILVGDGNERNKVERDVDKRGLRDLVVFLGYRNDIPEILSAADIFLLPSLYEGLPLSIVEAQCSGLQSIISDTVTKEIDFGDGLCSFVSVHDIKAIENWDDEIMQYSSTDKREKYVYRARERHYDINDEARRVFNKYLELINTYYD